MINGSQRVSSIMILMMLFCVGFILMGFEMLGSRYLNPYFGSGITTWACLISVVLFAMMIGYFAGGYTADRHMAVEPLAVILTAAAFFIGIVAFVADFFIANILDSMGDGLVGTMLASFSILFVPVALLSACSPYVVRLLLTELKTGGRVTGMVYSVSTFGNVVGTLVTTFWMIPEFGTRSITKMFAAALLLLAILVMAYAWSRVNREKVLAG